MELKLLIIWMLLFMTELLGRKRIPSPLLPRTVTYCWHDCKVMQCFPFCINWPWPQQIVKKLLSDVPWLYTPFYNCIVEHNRFFHILKFLNLFGSQHEVTKMMEIMSLWEIRMLLDMLYDGHEKFSSLAEHLVLNKIIMLFKGRK